ncbi:porin [Azohydromonas australica]|uniref:porin n=1 Tax=Azohydromonas australica TaxID=364039 RepID=UPI00048CD2A2|nr:porin [Azohydromonas australica]
MYETFPSMRTVAVLAALGACAFSAWAEASFTFGGYGTLGAVRASTDEVQFRSSPRQHKGADRSVDLGVDSRLGLQATLHVDEAFSAVGQVLTSRRDGREGPQLEWLYVQSTPMQGLDLRAGRLVLPIFMVSDTRNVGYAIHWLRAPNEVYGPYAHTSFDGAQLLWRSSDGPVNLGVQASAGTSEAPLFLAVRTDLKYRRLYSVAVTAERNAWTLRASRTLGKGATFSGTPVPSGDDTFTDIGAQYDDGRFIAVGEYIWRSYSAMGLLDHAAFYVSAGLRLGSLTPYATYARFMPEGLSFGVNAPDGTTRAVGLRWDVARNVALKAQIEATRHSKYAFVDPTPGFTARQPSVRAMSVAMDFVF